MEVKQNPTTRIWPQRLILPAGSVHSCRRQRLDTEVLPILEAREEQAGGSGESLEKEGLRRRPIASTDSQYPQ